MLLFLVAVAIVIAAIIGKMFWHGKPGCGCSGASAGASGALEGLRDMGTPETSHTIDLPLNNPTSCRNMCINARCSATGQQCLSDIDCPGCNPYKGGDTPFDVKNGVRGDNDAGKLTAGVTPTYSVLTSDIGTRAAVINENAKVPIGMGLGGLPAGVAYAQSLYNKRYRPTPTIFTPNYKTQPSTTGLFMSDAPLPANY
jgi:hypothetical protein